MRTATTFDHPATLEATNLAARAVDAVKVYGEGDVAVRALDRVTVDVPRSAFTTVMGPSGCGKSTLVHCLAGLDTLALVSERASIHYAVIPRTTRADFLAGGEVDGAWWRVTEVDPAR